MAPTSNQPFQYSATTRGITVGVTPHYLEDQSEPQSGRYVWAYEIEIANGGDTTVQLRERYWEITDAKGTVQIVEGPGVVGEQPILNPGDAFRYSSGCPLNTSSGFMVGHYKMMPETDAGEEGKAGFRVSIPAFSLDVPDDIASTRGRLN